MKVAPQGPSCHLAASAGPPMSVRPARPPEDYLALLAKIKISDVSDPQRLGNRVVGEIEPTGDALSLAGDGLTVIAYTAAAGQPGGGPAEAAAPRRIPCLGASRDIASRRRTRLTPRLRLTPGLTARSAANRWRQQPAAQRP